MEAKTSESEDVLQRFGTIRVSIAGGKRRPHKPLLALWAIGRCLRGEPRMTSYEVVDRELARLLRQFAPRRKTIHTEDPFWRMQFDDVWEITHANKVRLTSKGGAFKSDLRDFQTQGGLTASDYKTFQQNPRLALRVARYLVELHFPKTLYGEVLSATSIPEDVSVEFSLVGGGESKRSRAMRDSKFRKRVLEAYGNKCAVCEFAVKREHIPLALEAAHIKWHVAKGPSVIENGLALCALHHNLFDRGAFTLSPELTVIVARDVVGVGMRPTLGMYDGARVKVVPHDGAPATRFLAWHWSEVFREPSLLAR